MATNYWVNVQFEGSAGKWIAYIPGLAQATRATKDDAFKAIIDQMKAQSRLQSIDVHAYKLLLTK